VFEQDSRQIIEAQLHAMVPKALRVLDEEGFEVDEDWGVVRKGSRRGVYFVRAGEDGPIKIGVSSDVDGRIKSLQTDAPAELHLLAVLDGAGRDVEQSLHVRFADGRLTGEWFQPTDELLATVKAVNEGQWMSTAC